MRKKILQTALALAVANLVAYKEMFGFVLSFCEYDYAFRFSLVL